MEKERVAKGSNLRIPFASCKNKENRLEKRSRIRVFSSCFKKRTAADNRAERKVAEITLFSKNGSNMLLGIVFESVSK